MSLFFSCLYISCILQLGSSLSIYGCRKYQDRGRGDANIRLDAERGTYVAPSLGESSVASSLYKNLDTHEEYDAQETAGAWGYIFQIIFQVDFYLSSVSSVFDKTDELPVRFVLLSLLKNISPLCAGVCWCCGAH